MNALRRIGFVGLGRMGWPMASHLVRGGFYLVVHDVRPNLAAEFAAKHGGRPAVDLADLGSGADAVVTTLPTSAAVRDVILGAGKGGVADGLESGAIVIDAGASDPAQTRALGPEQACAALWKEAEETLGFNADQTEVARLWEKRTNVSLVSK